MKTKMFFSVLLIGILLSIAMINPNEKLNEINYENLSLSEQLIASFPDLIDLVEDVKLNQVNEFYYYSVIGLKDGKATMFNVATSKENAVQKSFGKNSNLLQNKGEETTYCYDDGPCGCVVRPTCGDTGIICGIFVNGQCQPI